MRIGVTAVVALVAAVVLLPPSVVGHPYHLLVSNEVLNSPEQVDSNNWIAQSFLAPSDFFVSRISLYVADTGVSESLMLSIRPTALNFPASTTLNQGTADGPASPGWLDVDLDPRPLLNSGNSYWIVARSPTSGGQGYDWWDSGTDFAYPDGIGVTSSDGVVWSPRGRDFTFRVYGFVQPALSFSASANSTVRVGAMTTVTVSLSNAGPGTASTAWVNVSLPAHLAYVADDAPAAGGTLSGTYSYLFTNIGPGSNSFNITVQAATGVVNGTTVLVRVAIDPKDHNGVSLTPFVRNLGVTILGGPEAPATPSEIPWWWLVPLPVAIALGALLLLLRRRAREVTVDDVFVADKGGILLAHRSASIVPYQDEDVLIGMFKVIQDFVRDAFSRGTEERFHALEFGERRILIERGRWHFVAVVYRGKNKEDLADRVRKVSEAIDANFGNVIESWSGEIDDVKGITLLLPRVWKRRA